MKHFNLLLIGVVVLGLAVGAGLAALKPMSAQGSSVARTNQSSGQGSPAASNQQEMQGGQALRAVTGQGASNGQADQSRAAGTAGRGTALTGSVTSLQDGVVTLSTAEGDVKVKLGDARIQKTVDGTVDDLKQGERIMVIGQQGSDGTYSASTVQIMPQGGQDGQGNSGQQGAGGHTGRQAPRGSSGGGQ